MSADERAQSYAHAFFEAALERWLAALSGVAEQLKQHPELAQRLGDAEADFAARQRQLDALLPPETDAPVRNLLYTLLQRNDLSLLDEIADALCERLRRTETGPTAVEVTSAVPLIETERQTVVTKLQEQYGQALDVRYRVDPAIMGGLVIRVGDQLIDNSVASRLAALKQALGVATAG